MLGRYGETSDKESKARPEEIAFDGVDALVSLFSVFPGVRSVILFGSRARGDHQERSDIDVAVDAPNMDIVEWDELCLYIHENSNTLLPIDLIWLQQATLQLANRIQSEGVVVFERKDESIS